MFSAKYLRPFGNTNLLRISSPKKLLEKLNCKIGSEHLGKEFETEKVAEGGGGETTLVTVVGPRGASVRLRAHAAPLPRLLGAACPEVPFNGLPLLTCSPHPPKLLLKMSYCVFK